MTEKIRIGQIGLGHNHGEPKMRCLRRMNDCFEVVGYAEENEVWVSRRAELAGYRGLPRFGVAELIGRCDALLVESDVADLTRYTGMCIAAGRHVHMDKPAGGTPAQFKALLDSAAENKVAVQLGYMYRYNPAVQRLFSAVQAGKLGRVLSVDAQISTFHSKEYRRWLSGFDGGVMYIMGSHMVDLTVRLLGEPAAITSFMGRTRTDGIDLPDNTLAVLQYDGGVLARIFASSVEVNGWGRRRFAVSGEKGTIEICPMENSIGMTYSDTAVAPDAYRDMKQTVDIRDVSLEHRYDAMLREFYGIVTGRTENPYSYAHDYAVHRTLFRILYGDAAC